MECYWINWDGRAQYYCAESRGKARAMAARTISEMTGLTIGEALKQIRCRRAAKYDAACCIAGPVCEQDLMERSGQLRLPFMEKSP